ncbi:MULTISPECIES: acyl-CoA dehydrogenase family protein [unclassified Nocardia]|uniref:acyl-CoA dehydrogenase family protein n=1 Tax=unclassified Nocardia TaxID=2637762 RepID=UPI001CE3F12C|nr:MULTISPECIES: acyl-CoA dehydrogenase family protein [unclassified Nocardia]
MAAKSSLIAARETAERLLPGLLDELIASAETISERDEHSLIPLWVRHEGPRLVAPRELGGLGASAVDAVRVMIAIGATTPALGAAITMHYLSVATLAVFADHAGESEREQIRQLILARAVVASGFSEGRPGGSIFHPTMRATKCEGGYLLTGRKAPCSLSDSMDVLTASVELDSGERAVALVPAKSENMTVRPFWRAHTLRGAESNMLELDGTFCPESLVVPSLLDDPTGATEMLGYQWFGLLILGTYLGAAYALLDYALAKDGAIDPKGVVPMAGFLPAVENALLGLAAELDAKEVTADAAAELLALREAFDECIDLLVGKVKFAAGGITYMRNPDIGYLAEVCTVHRFHPPSMRDSGANLVAWLRNEHEFRFV